MQHLMTEFAYKGDAFKGRACVQPDIVTVYTKMAEDVYKKNHSQFWNSLPQEDKEQLFLRETRNYGYMSYYAKGYGFSVFDVFQNAGYHFTWQNPEEKMLCNYLHSCEPSQYTLIKNYVEYTVAPISLYPDSQSMMMDPRRRVLWLLRTQPFSKVHLKSIYENNAKEPHSINWNKYSEAQRSKITCNDIYDLSRYLRVSFSWLMGITTGHHPIFATTEIDYICAKYTLLSPDNQSVVKSLIAQEGQLYA